jgi:hypothetical protein
MSCERRFAVYARQSLSDEVRVGDRKVFVNIFVMAKARDIAKQE